MKKRILNLLGLATRARKIKSGEDQTYLSIRSGAAKLCFVASDAGPNTKKQMRNKCHFYKVILIEDFDRNELSKAIGANRVCLAVIDTGFAKQLIKMRGENNDKNSRVSEED